MKVLNRQFIKKDSYPEKVLQFGTGVLLRGLPDYFIEKANQKGVFGGSVLVVKSTGTGGTDRFKEQDNVYTLHIKGLEDGRDVQNVLVISAINRVIAAATHWEAVLESARNPEIEIVISNTTEVGIALDERDDLYASPPASFPGKLTAVLFERFKAFNGAGDKGMVILPTELIDKNGAVLEEIVIALAERHQLGNDFIDWLKNHNYFCNTLVDRIVPGSLGAVEKEQAEKELGYKDDLAIMAEPFCLWAIEASHSRVSEVLTFGRVDSRIVITPDIRRFKELKLRLLNGSHTFACGLALLAGFETVKEAMANEVFSTYVKRLMQTEIIPTLVENGIDEPEALEFANHVIDRFSNPYLEHKWESIRTNYTSKMRLRNIATLERHFARSAHSADCMALGFAGYLQVEGNGEPGVLLEKWENDLRPLGDLLPAVAEYLQKLQETSPLELMGLLNTSQYGGT